MVESHLTRQAGRTGEEAADELGVGKAFSELAGKLMGDPFKLAQMSLRMWQDYFTLWQNTALKASGAEAPTVADAGKSDNWSSIGSINPLFVPASRPFMSEEGAGTRRHAQPIC